MLEITTREDGALSLRGRLDAGQVDKAHEAFEKLEGTVTLDLTEMNYVASAGISVLLRLYQRLDAGGHALRLANPTPHVRNIFRYAGLDQIMTIVDENSDSNSD
jgi:anti-anti-sigma factor